jgi:hypothetical protein
MGVKVTGKGDGAELSKQEEAAAPDAEEAIETAELDEPQAEDQETDEGLSTVSRFQSSVRIGSGEQQLDQLVLEAKRESGLTTAKWNALTRDERTTHIKEIVDRKIEEEKASTEAAADDTTAEVKDVRVSMDRGVGGRYVALGAGERIRVGEASTQDTVPVKDDAEFKAA